MEASVDMVVVVEVFGSAVMVEKLSMLIGCIL